MEYASGEVLYTDVIGGLPRGIVLRLLQRLVLAIVTIVLCASVTSVVRRVAVAGAIDAAVADAHVAARCAAPAPDQSQEWQDADDRVADLKAVESEFDEEDRDVSDVADEAPQALSRIVASPETDRVSRGEAQFDTSRFAVGTGLPRGPPV